MEEFIFDWTEFWHLILGDMSITFLIAFAIFSNLGMFFTMITHLKIHKHNQKKKGNDFKFNIWYWIADNLKRFITNQLAVFIVVRFSEQLQSKIEKGMWLGFVTGMGIDVIIIVIRRYSPVNFFQSSIKK